MLKKEKENNIVENNLDVDIDEKDPKVDYKKRLQAKKLCDQAFKFIKTGNKEEANNLIDEAYALDENFADIFLAKLYLSYDVKTYNELRSKANEEIVNSPFFKAAYDLGDQKLKDKLNYVVEEVEYKRVELNLEGADIEQLLKHLRIQKQKHVDYTYTISLILTTLYKAFRYITKQFVDENLVKDNLIAILRKGEGNFQYYVDILYHFDDISDIKDIIGQIIKEHKGLNAYLLLVLRKVIENSFNDKDKLIDIKSFLEFTYVNHEADDLINLINPHLKQNKEVNKRALIVGSLCSTMVIAFIGIGIGAATNTRDAPVILNGVTYIKNNSNGYTIAAYDFESNSLTLEDSIDGLPVNEINPTLFANSDIQYIYNFPDNIREIPKGCFESCDSLVEIEISSSSILSSIGENAFKDCVYLTTLNIPQFVQYIGQDAFLNTPNLINLTKETHNEFDEDYIGLTRRALEIDLDNGEILDSEGEAISLPTYFYSWDELEFTLPQKQNYDFVGFEINDNPETVVSPDENNETISISTQGYYSLDLKAEYLTAERFVDSENGYKVTYIALDDRTHYRLESVERIDSDFTTNSLILRHYIGGVPVDEMNPVAFSGSVKRSISQIINFSTYIREIPDDAFNGCVKLEEFIFSNSEVSQLERIGNNAFRDCSSLNSIILPSSVKEIGDGAFAGTESLTEFSSSYDFFPNGDTTHQEAIRIGFTPREYTYTIEDSDIPTQSGVYFIPEEVLRIDFDPRANMRGVLIDEIDGTVEVASSDKAGFIYFNVMGHKSLDLHLYYENYYSSDLYNSEIQLGTINEIEIRDDEDYVLSLDTIMYDKETKLRAPYIANVAYVVDQDAVTSNVDYKINSSGLILRLKEGSTPNTSGAIAIYSEIRGTYSNKTMITSDRVFISIRFTE